MKNRFYGFLFIFALFAASIVSNNTIAQDDSTVTDTVITPPDTEVQMPTTDIGATIASASTTAIGWTIFFVFLGLVMHWVISFRSAYITKTNIGGVPGTAFQWGKWISDVKNWTSIVIFIITMCLLLYSKPTMLVWQAFALGLFPNVVINWMIKETTKK